MRLTVERDRGHGGLEAAVEGDERGRDVEGNEGGEVGGGEPWGSLGTSDVERSLLLDALEDRREGRGGRDGECDGPSIRLVRRSERGPSSSSTLVSRVPTPEPAREVEEVDEHDFALLGEDALRVILEGLEGVLAMPQAHDDTGLGPARNFELVGEGVEPRGKRVIPGRLDALRDALEEPLAVVLDGARFAVHDLACGIDLSTVRDVHTLETHAYAEDRDLAGVLLDGGDGDAAVAERVAGSGRDDEVGEVGVLGVKLFEGDGF